AFFFQAEDGIRDKLVTGVQTCALPISPRQSRPPARRRDQSSSAMLIPANLPPRRVAKPPLSESGISMAKIKVKTPVVEIDGDERSEERRVGKGGGCGGGREWRDNDGVR